MNCKQGDLAITIDSRYEGFIGKVVTVIKFVPQGCKEFSSARKADVLAVDSDVWLVEHQRIGTWLHSDSRMRPIRPGSLDETTDTDLKLKEPA